MASVMYRSNNNADDKSDYESSSSDGEIPDSETDDEVFQPNKRLKVGNAASSDATACENVQQQSNSYVNQQAKQLVGVNKYNLWSKVLVDQGSEEITRQITTSTLRHSERVERGVESVVRQRFRPDHKVSDNDTKPAGSVTKNLETKIENVTLDRANNSHYSNNGNRQSNNNNSKRRNNKNTSNNHKKCQKPKKKSNNCPTYTYGQIVTLNKRRVISEDSSMAEISEEIAFRLWERKRRMIHQVVELIGVQKALFHYQKTEMIEANGGMETLSKHRRRTPGGVFLRLIQMDESVDQQALKKVMEAHSDSLHRSNRKRNSNGKMANTPPAAAAATDNNNNSGADSVKNVLQEEAMEQQQGEKLEGTAAPLLEEACMNDKDVDVLSAQQ